MAQNNFLTSPFDAIAQQGEEDATLLPGQQAVKPAAKLDMPKGAPVEADPEGRPAPAARRTRAARADNYLPPDEVRPLFEAAAQKYDVPVNVLMALGHQESRYNAQAIGTPTEWGRAKGMMQYLDDTAKGMGINPFDPAQAVDAAAKQIRQRLDKGATMADAVMEHFAGPDRKRWGKKTAAYGEEVMAKAFRIGDMAGSTPAPQTAATGTSTGTDTDTPIPADWVKLTPEQAAEYEAKAGAEPDADLPKSKEPDFIDEYVLNPLKRGYKSMKQGFQSGGAMFDARTLEVIGRIDRGEVVPDQDDTLGYQHMNAEQRAEAKKMMGDAFQGAVKASAATGKEVAAIPQDPIVAAASNAKSFDEWWGFFKQKPLKFIANTGVESLPNMVPGLLLGAGAGVAAQATMKAGGAIAGAAGMGAGSYAVDYPSTMLSALSDLGIDTTNPDALAKAFSDPKIMKDVQKQAHAHATAVGTLDAASGGVAGKAIVAGKGIAKKSANLGAQTATQGALGASGEAAGQVAQGKDGLEWGAIMGEFAGEAAGAPVEVAGATYLKGKEALAARGTVPASTPAPAPSQASGPLTRSTENAVEQHAPQSDRVTVATPEGQASGTLQGYQEDEQGNFIAEVVGDDGQVHQLSSADGVQVALEEPADSGPLTASLSSAADAHQADPAPMPEAPAPQAPAQPDYTSMDLPALRERLKYIASQAKASGGWNKMFMTARKEVEREINQRTKDAKAETKLSEEPMSSGPFDDRVPANRMALRMAESTGQAHEVIEANGKFTIQPIGEVADAVPATADAGSVRPAAMPGNEPGAAVAPDESRADVAVPAVAAEAAAPALTDAHAGKWFGSQDKADAYLTKKKAGETHEVVQTGKVRFEVKPKATPAPKKDWQAKAEQKESKLAEQLAVANENAAKRKAKQVPMPTQTFKSTAGVGEIFAVQERYSDQHGVSWASTNIATLDTMEEAAAVAKAVADSGADNIAGMREVAKLFTEQKNTPVTKQGVSNDQPAAATPASTEAVSASDVQGEPQAVSGDAPLIAKLKSHGATRPEQIEQAARELADGDDALAKDLLRINEPEAAKVPELAPVAKDDGPAAGIFANNKVFTADAVEAARKRLKSKLTQINSGIDPEIMMDGITIAGAYLEAGTRKFSEYAKAMTDDFGGAIKPYLLSFYEAARHYPGFDKDGMSTPASAQAQHEAMMLDHNEVAKSPTSPTMEVKEKNNEPQQLDQPGARALEGAPAGQVQGAAADGQAGAGAQGSGRADARGNDGTGKPGDGEPRSLGDGARDVPVSEGGSAASRGAKPVRQPVQRGDGDPVGDGGSRGITPAAERADNYTIDPAEIGQGGPKAKYKNNLAAVRLLKQLNAEGRQATRAEQDVLAKYVGWGGIPQAFERSDGSASKGWDAEVAELKAALTPEELAAAQASTRNAHYTSPEIVTAMWQAMRRLGFSGGRVLEPSVGVGNFFGLMPAEMRNGAALNGVELDHITGGIAKHLYPQAKIASPMGFQDYTIPNGHFDAAIGNPPFGSEKLYDGKRKDLSGFSIHNYFFAKSIDGLKPNGVLAMVVTNRMMDVAGDKARQYIAKRAELLGAIRLPNNAFMANAGTEVTTDIIFLRKLAEGEKPTGEGWMTVADYTDKAGKTVPLNEYFTRHPEMMLGEFGAYGSMYSLDDPALVARPDQDTPALLAEAIARLPENVAAPKQRAPVVEKIVQATAADNVKVGSMYLADGTIMVREPDSLGETQAKAVEFPSDKAKERVAGMIAVRDALTTVRGMQLDRAAKPKAIESARAKLNAAYDAFVKANGPINLDANKRLFRDDPTWPQISALEEGFDKGLSPAVAKKTGEEPRKPSASKAAIFTKRTQSPYAPPTSAASAKDALVTSLSEVGRVDLALMERLYGKGADEITSELGDLVYQDPGKGWVTRDEYLSGNVKAKLAQAKDARQRDPAFARNIEALEAVQPADIEAVDINVKAGAHWLPVPVMTDFANHISEGTKAKVAYNPATASWTVIDLDGTQAARQRFQTGRVGLSKIIEATANQKTITVYDQHSDGTRTLNETETQLANDKANLVKEEWGRWIWQDDARRESLSRLYNDTFNTDVAREYDGSHLTFPGKVGDDIIRLRPHQAHAVWRITQSGTTLTDHVVGAGKTFTLIAAAMELRRMGLAKKPAFAVPNHLVGQWAADFSKLYPGANVLAASKADFEKGNRKRLFARIATGDWDAVIVAHSSFGKVEVDPKEQAAFIEEQIADLMTSMETVRAAEGKASRNVKKTQEAITKLREKLKALFDAENKDDSLYWSELGIDAVFVDEAHEFKNLTFSSSMNRVAGLGNQKGSQKAADMFMKIRQTLKSTGGRNVVFATGTPISNTMAEMYTMQRYLDYDTMKAQGLSHFDAWARMFGEVVTDWELSPSGQYKMNSRFAKFVNMPELMQRYTSFADVINRDDINRMLAAQGKKLPVPKVTGGKPQNVVVERSPVQARYIGEPIKDADGNDTQDFPKGTLVWRSENLPKKAEKGADNMLKVMGDARKAALDMRLIDPSAADYAGSKVNVAAGKIKAIYDRTAKDAGTQLVFIDLSTPKAAKGKEAQRIRDLLKAADEGDDAATEALDKMSPDELSALESDFSVYDDLKAKLIAQGIPENEIAFIHDAGTELQKEELFGKVRSGRVRVMLGSTAKMGAGMNVQDRLVALHHLDAPWRPSDLEQREGRIIRQGNRLYERDPENFEVEILRYATKQTLDSRMWQTIEGKANFIEQVRKGTAGSREIEDVAGEAANSAEMKAASSGNPLILEEMTLRQQIKKLDTERAGHEREQYRLRDTVRHTERLIEYNERKIKELTADAALAQPEEFAITIGNKEFDKRADAGEAILAKAEDMGDTDTATIGKFGGFTLQIERVNADHFIAALVGTGEYETSQFTLSADPQGVAQRVVNAVRNLEGEIAQLERRVAQSKKDIPALQKQAAPWSKAADLDEAKGRHAAVLDQLKPKKKEAKAEEKPAETPAYSVTDDSAADAITQLMAAKDGEAAINRPDVGDILVAYGDAKSGLAHIARRRGAAFVKRIPALLRDGKVYEKPGQTGRIFIGNDIDEAVIRLDRDGETMNWLLSAYEKHPDLAPASVKESLVEQPGAASAMVMSPEQVKAAITTGVIGPVIARLVEHGAIVIHKSAKTLPKGAGKVTSGVQAVTMPDGTIHFVAGSINKNNARAVLLHELFHKGGESFLGSKEWSSLMGRMGSLYSQSEQSSGKAREFYDRARERVAAAKAKGAVTTRMEVEEFAAYAIEEYETNLDGMPAVLRKWVEDLIGLVKAWIVQRYGKQLGQVTPAQLSAFAKMAIMDVAVAKRGEMFGPIGELFSVGSARTIEVDGVRRSITNSKGQLVAQDFAGQKAFWQWFGDSGIVDEQGRPLVNYHGTADSFATFDKAMRGSVSETSDSKEGFFFTSSPDRANAAAWDAGYPGGENVMPVYLAMNNPLIVDEDQGLTTETAKIIRRAKRNKYDGVIFSNGELGGQDYVVFEPEQIKSVTGNAGTFDPANPDIRYSVAADTRPSAKVTPSPEPVGLTPPEQGRLRRIQSQLQDNMNRLKQVQDRIMYLTGRTTLGRSDAYGAETNRPGRIAARKEDAQDHLFKPLMERIAKAGHTPEQLVELLHAMHAQERNKKVGSKNPSDSAFYMAVTDHSIVGASGMSTDKAEAILKNYAKARELHALADEARAIAKATLDLKLAYELIKAEDHEALTTMYEYYVPLKGDGEYGPRIKQATGHGEREEHILENIARDYDQAVVVGEKNLARQSLLQMVLQFKDDALWTARVPPRGRYVAGQVFSIMKGSEKVASFTSKSQVSAFLEALGPNAATHTVENSAGDKVVEFVKPLQDNEVMVYIKGDPVRIQIHDEALARQLRPLDQGKMHIILEKMRGMNRYLSKIYTGYNPAFILRNTARDAMTGTINMLGNNGAAVAAKAWTKYPSAIKALSVWAATKKTPDSKAGRYLTEYRMHGGKVGASWMSDLEEQGKTLERMYEDAYGAAGYLKAGKTGKAAKVAGRKIIGGMAHAVEIANQATENALRLSLFIALREEGVSAGKAAQSAKGVTVDFDRKGTSTAALGAIYLFFNPAVQGSANAIKTLVKGQHRKQAWAALGGLAVLGYYAAAQGMGDDRDRWLGEGWETRTKNFMINIGGHQIRVPLSQEFAPIYSLGVAIAEAANGESKIRSSARVVSSFLDAYFPLQGAYKDESDNHALDLGMSAVPTILKPYMETAVNRNTFGSDIVPESEFTKDRPDNLKMTRGTKNSPYDAAAQGIASAGELLGAGKYENDISKVSPETLKHFWRTYTGGLGQFVSDSVGVASMTANDPAQVNTSDVPLLKDFVRTNDVKPIRGRYYEMARDAQKAIGEFELAKKAGDGAAMDAIIKDDAKANLIGLGRMVRSTTKAVAAIRDEAVEINADTSMSQSDKRAALKAIEQEEEKLYREAISAFK